MKKIEKINKNHDEIAKSKSNLIWKINFEQNFVVQQIRIFRFNNEFVNLKIESIKKIYNFLFFSFLNVNDFEFAKFVIRLNLIVNFIDDNEMHIVKSKKIEIIKKKIYEKKKMKKKYFEKWIVNDN